MKKVYRELLEGIALLTGLILVFSGVIYFIWNVVALWLIPSFSGMSMLVALGLSTVFGLGTCIANFWTNQYVAVKKAKSSEVLQSIEVLLYDTNTRLNKLEATIKDPLL